MSDKKVSMEEKLTMIDEIIAKLEDDNTTLEEAFNEYSKGVKLAYECNQEIDKVEKNVLKLMSDGTTCNFD